MNWAHKSSVVLITGRQGSGKTTEAVARIKSSRYRWLFVFDSRPEFSVKLRQPICRNPQELLAAVKARRPVYYFSGHMFPGDRPKAFAFFSEWCYRVGCCLEGEKLFVCDEIDAIVMPGNGGVPPEFKVLLDEGRREEFNHVWIAQRPSKVNDVLRSQLTEMIVFRQTDRLQLAALKTMGVDPGTVSKLKMPGGKLSISI